MRQMKFPLERSGSGGPAVLSDFFTGIAAKRLSPTEADSDVSNGHELGGVTALRELFGEDELRDSPATYMYVTDDEDGRVEVESRLSWYDSRRNQPHRAPEYRLYYSDTTVSDAMLPGDLVIVAATPGKTTLLIVVQSGSIVESQIRWLFGLPERFDRGFVIRNLAKDDIHLGIGAAIVLEALGIVAGHIRPDLLEEMLKRFNGSFPSTKAFSSFARETAEGPDATVDPDGALLSWWTHEEALFRTLEKRIVEERIQDGFAGVEDFIETSLGILNRRKSRAGYALEHHIEQVLVDNQIEYVRGARTENRAKPDFLFPSAELYDDPQFPANGLSMLAAKATVKERWRQVLSEAARIPNKHLLTLSPGITENQTDEMKANSLQLVIPTEIQETYSVAQRDWLVDLAGFIDVVRLRQSRQ